MNKKYISNRVFFLFDELIDYLNGLALTGKYVFRGFSKQDQLLPGIIRDSDYSNREKELLTYFEKYGSSYYSANSPIDFMSYAQHFGLPTRLIDFTRNPYIALSFALYMPKGSKYKYNDDKDFYYIVYASREDNIVLDSLPINNGINNSIFHTNSMAKQTCASIGLIDDYFSNNYLGTNPLTILSNSNYPLDIVNSKTTLEKIKQKRILFIEPNQSNQRIIMQQGLFMFPYCLDEKEHSDIVRKNTHLIKIHKNARMELLKYLETLGFDSFRLMPDLASICNAITRKVKDSRDNVIPKEKEDKELVTN